MNDQRTVQRPGPNWLKLLALTLVAVIVLTGVLVTGVAGGIAVDRLVLVEAYPPLGYVQAGSAPAAAATRAVSLDLIAEAWNSIQKNDVAHDDVSQQDLTYGAVSGMVEALNDTGHSRFLSPEMLQAETNSTRGVYDGIGAEVATKGGQVVIVAPLDGSPAEKAGLHSGQVIMKVNDEDVSSLPLQQVISRILGPAGSEVTMVLFDPATGKMQEVTMQRARLTLKNVTWQFVPSTKIAHVRIGAFSDGIAKALQTALTDARRQGATGVILDLRDNPGGLLSEAIDAASQFISTGDVLLVRDAQGKTTHMPAKKGGKALDIPVVVLVNGGSASASEIVSSALQDAKRAQLVGETTFGTGTVLNQFPLSDGSALLLATQEWLTPSGRVIWHKGVTPDVVVKQASDIMPLRPSRIKDMTIDELRSYGDAQLLKALDLLQTATAAK